VELEQFVTPGLGDSSYMVASEGEAALIDPQRDVGRMLAAAAARGLRVRHVLETHVHNDYVSGALEARAASGAEIAAPAQGGYGFPHTGLEDGGEVRVGGLRLVAMGTPGHTPEHLSYVALPEGAAEPAAVFSGGSLIVGSSGRTDLLGPDRADELARAQFASMQRLRSLPGSTRVFPTHGAGSFCASSLPSGERTSTIEAELRQNPSFAAPDQEAFLALQRGRLLAFPAYYRHMAPINRAGPRVLGPTWPRPAPLTPSGVAERASRGAWIVDARDRAAFAAAHLPGSVNVELNDEFASYVGWVVPFGAAIAFVLPHPEREAAGDAATQLLRIGYEALEGYLDGGVEAWRSAGLALRSYPTATAKDLCDAYRRGEVDTDHIVDVRQQTEWDEGHVAGSRHLFVGDLPGREGELPLDGELWVACRSGHRAAIAASLADAAGATVRLVVRDGVPHFLARCGPGAAQPRSQTAPA